MERPARRESGGQAFLPKGKTLKSAGFTPGDLNQIQGSPACGTRAGAPLHHFTGGNEVGDVGGKLLNMRHSELLFHQDDTPRTMVMSWTALRTMCSPTALQMEPPLS